MPKGVRGYRVNADVVRTVLLLKGVPVRTASVSLGLDQHALGKVLRGERTLAWHVVEKLCALVELEESDVLDGDRASQDKEIGEWHFRRQTACGEANASRLRNWARPPRDE